MSRVWGRHSPTSFPQGQNERQANFGTVVETCSARNTLYLSRIFGRFYPLFCGASEKISLYAISFWRDLFGGAANFFINKANKAAHSARCGFAFLYGRKQKMPNETFLFSSLLRSACAVLPKMGAKKSSKSFQTYCLCAAVVGDGYLIFQWEIKVKTGIYIFPKISQSYFISVEYKYI